MKKPKLHKKLNFKKESIANLHDINGGEYEKGSEVDPYTCHTIIIDECFLTKFVCQVTYFNCQTRTNVC